MTTATCGRPSLAMTTALRRHAGASAPGLTTGAPTDGAGALSAGWVSGSMTGADAISLGGSAVAGFDGVGSVAMAGFSAFGVNGSMMTTISRGRASS
jgi:hypothetical protein